MRRLCPVALTREDFSPFGEVMQLDDARRISINRGLTTRFHDLFTIDCDADGGRPIVSVFRTEPLPMPHRIETMERHPLGSQAFIPLDREPFLLLVAPPGDTVSADDLVLFRTNGDQGVNFARNTWHHYQIVIGQRRDFMVIDRGGPGDNLEETLVVGEAVLKD